MIPEFKLYALRYAHRPALRHENFIGGVAGDPHDAPMPLDYFVWLAVSPEGRAILVDTGFTAQVAEQRKRQWFRCPIDSLALLGVAPSAVEDCILTHLHYDHVGTFHKLPNARFHLQEAELHFAVGRYMKYEQLRHSFEVEDVVGIVRANYAGRVTFYDGGAELCPGITLHPAPGHSAGLQFVRVHTARGWVVIASDVTHFYEHMETGRVFTTAFHIGGMLEGYDLLRAAAPTPQHIVPGHDPLVMQRYKPPTPELDGIVVRLDEPPTE